MEKVLIVPPLDCSWGPRNNQTNPACLTGAQRNVDAAAEGLSSLILASRVTRG